ncbi:hypothetical protein DW884_20885 [Ruminococcus sp. AM40-10AC]|nr:hypothetical protein DW884_20885 [Ruminococcus sp. AM40-10AC]
MPRLPPQPSVIFLLWYNSPFSFTPCQHSFCCFCFLNNSSIQFCPVWKFYRFFL